MLISYAWLVPHLPTLVIDEHRGHFGGMVQAMRAASERLSAEQPDVIVALSARWTTPGPFLVDTGRRHPTLTDYSGFGVEVRYDCAGHPKLGKALVEAARKAKLRVSAATRGLDSGLAVPLHFMAPRREQPVVPLSIGERSPEECRQWGEILGRTLAAWPERVAFIVGGLLSYNAHAWSLRRDVPEGISFDERALDSLRNGRWSDLRPPDAALLEKAQPEAGLRHLDLLRGFLGQDIRGDVRCYEPSPGVGAALVEFPVPAGREVGAS
jgi:aromatic ring-opening dioxygenase catalytic subunit (LigB family)